MSILSTDNAGFTKLETRSSMEGKKWVHPAKKMGPVYYVLWVDSWPPPPKWLVNYRHMQAIYYYFVLPKHSTYSSCWIDKYILPAMIAVLKFGLPLKVSVKTLGT